MNSLESVFSEIQLAEQRIRSYIRETPLEYSSYLSNLNRSEVFLKMEQIQYTGSFKIRGAFNKLLSLTPEQRSDGVIVASTGNHGLATSFALSKLKGQGTIFLPENASPAKIAKLQEYNVELKYYGLDSSETEVFARQTAMKQDKIYISPYNDMEVIVGQGTLGIELKKQLNDIDTILITVGGGGLITGIASYFKSVNPEINIVGCLPKNSPVFYESIKAGNILTMDIEDTISDGSAGGIEADAITFNLVRNHHLVDRYILVTEQEIMDAMHIIFHHHRQIIEGAAGVAVAALIKEKENLTGNTIVILCGGNIDMNKFLPIVCKKERKTS